MCQLLPTYSFIPELRFENLLIKHNFLGLRSGGVIIIIKINMKTKQAKEATGAGGIVV